MYSIPEEMKQLYKLVSNDIPDESIRKKIYINFPDKSLIIENDKIVRDSFSLNESLCSSNDLVLGSCEASYIEFTVIGIPYDLTGLTFTVIQSIGSYSMPFGTFKVKSCKEQSDRNFKDILAFDSMTKTDVDVSNWYNDLTWPQTIKSMRESLLMYLGLEFESQTITNDTETIDMTINPASLIGRDVLRRLTELNAGFGHFTRDGNFKVVQLSGLGLYPSETLYPSEDLFPSESGEYITAGYETIDYEEYIVEQITSVTVREDDEDTGATAGTPGNDYIISGNFLLFGKDSTSLQRIVDNIFLQVKNKYYRPHNTKMIGLPYMEVGDSVTIITSDDAIESFIFKRTLTGIHALQDVISASGNQYRDQKVTPTTEIQQLKSKTLRIQKSVDGVSIDLSNLETETNAKFELQDDAIELRVEKAGVIAAINLSPETAKIEAPNIQLEGIVTANNYFKVLLDGSIEAVNGKFTGTITSNSATITGGSFNVTASGQYDTRIKLTYSNFTNTMSPYETIIKNASSSNFNTEIRPGEIFLGNPTGVNSTLIQYNQIQTPYLEIAGAVAISEDNKNSYTFPPATHTHSSLYTGSYQVFLGSGGGFASQNGGDLGSSTFRWGTVYAQTGTINTSDKNLKNSIDDLSDIYEQLILRSRPVKFKYNDGTSDRFHTGFISQDIENLMIELGMSDKDFAGFVKAPVHEFMNEYGEYDINSQITGYIYMLRYEEFIPLLTKTVQNINNRLKVLESQ